MNLSRRRLFHFSLLALGTSALSVSTGNRSILNAAARHSSPQTVDLAQVPARVFKAVKNSIFSANVPGQKTIDLTLKQVSEYHKSDKTEAFSLTLQGRPNEDILEQGTYQVSHPKLGTMNLFMVPGKGDRFGPSYTVIFNRLVGV